MILKSFFEAFRMKISEHRPILLYLCTVIIVVLALILTGIAIIIPYSIPLLVGVIAAIFGYFNAKKSQKKYIEIEEKEIAVPRLPTPYFVHPYPIQKNFIGREKERKELSEWLKNNSFPMFVIAAIGGMGKSALAWYWIKEDILNKEKSLKGIIWWSFYNKEASFENFLNHSIEYISGGEFNAKKIDSIKNKMDVFYALLSENKFILVLDGAERLLKAYAGMGSPYQGDNIKMDKEGDYNACIEPNCGFFLQMLASLPKSKTLITTRICPKELNNLAGVMYNKLEKMDKDDAIKFLKKQGIKGTRSEIEEVCNFYGFHPLSLRILSGMILHDIKYCGDIKVWNKYNPIPKLSPKEHNILELAYNSLDKIKQEFISKLSAFRNPMDYYDISIFNDFGSEEKFNDALIELINRGILDRIDNKFDLHPIVRKYCYDRLSDKVEVHSKLKDYFLLIADSEKIESLDDLSPVIELYHHTVRAEMYNEAIKLYQDKLSTKLYSVFGAYQIGIEVLCALFPDGENRLPRLKDKSYQAWTLNELANYYVRSGQPRKAANFFRISLKLMYMTDFKKNLAICLNNLAHTAQILLGELDAAESNLRRSMKISSQIRYTFCETIGHQELGRLLVYRGKFEEAENEFTKSTNYWRKTGDKQGICIDKSYQSISALLISNTDKALKFAEEARELADDAHFEHDIIHAELLIGSAHLMKGNLLDAEKHLTKALAQGRKINHVELEPDILLEFAKLAFRQNHKEESLKFAEEALLIADRCEYRLKQVDIHNFLAEFYLDADNLKKAREHGENAREMAGCGYKPAMEKAEKLLRDIDLTEISVKD